MGATSKTNGHRHSILDLAPLELECMNALWPLGEATVRQIRSELSSQRPRAYTTVMTIMDRLAQKGIVTRRRAGRAWVYQPGFSAGEARDRAVQQVVKHYFAGSEKALLAHVKGQPPVEIAGEGVKTETEPVANDLRPVMEDILL